MSIAPRRYTYDDLADTPDDGRRYEIIGGELIVSAVPFLDHQRVVGRLLVSLTTFVREQELGEVFPSLTAVKLSDEHVVQPDALFVAQARSVIIGREYVAGAPDMVIEVLSDETRHRDLGAKKALYVAAGVAEYWVADPAARTFKVWTMVDGGYKSVAQEGETVRSRIVPGFEVSLTELFATM